MKRLTYNKRTHSTRLMAEIHAALPALSPQGDVAQFYILGNATQTDLLVPDAAPTTTLDAVVAAHDGTPDPAPPTPDYGTDDTTPEQLADAVQNLRAYLALASPSNAQTIGAFKLLIRVVLFVLRRLVR